MSCCTHDEKTACLSYLFCLVLYFSPVFFDKLLILGSCVKYLLIVCFSVAGSLDYHFLAEIELSHFVLCKEFLVTAELDIRTTSCHICSNGNCAQLTCLCNDLCFLFVELSVQHVMLDTLSLEKCAQLL